MEIENQYPEQVQCNEIKEDVCTSDNSQDKVDIKGEFNISVRKLKLPVRPRGVLAE